MGILDRFRAKPPTAPTATPTSPATTTAPTTPVHATIETFVTADGVGSLVLPDQTSLRFGRSACKGFEPVVGARVVVVETKHQFGGWRAITVTLDDARYASLLAERDRALGVKPQTATAALETAQALAAITIVLREKLPPDAELRAWAAERSGNGVVVSVDRGLEVTVDGRSLLVYPGRTSYPCDDTKLGHSFIGLGNGLPGSWRMQRAAGIGVPDLWGERGSARDISRVVKQLAPHAKGVVLQRALEAYVEIEDFVDALGDLSADAAPFRAWLLVRKASGNDNFITMGMDAFGFPNVFAPTEGAVRAAAARMIESNALLVDGETIDVDGVSYTACTDDDWVRLTRC